MQSMWIRIRAWNSVVTLVVFGALIVVAAGCATIMQGTTQSVSISSQPTGANVTINGQVFGKTPLVADLRRKDKHMIRIEMDGYEPYEIGLGRKTSGWVWGNIVFGGIPGLAVDAITGGLYKLTPEQVEGQLQSSGTAALDSENQLLIITVLKPEKDWVKVGQMNSSINR